ncbi:hypothetical protein Sme01_55480 [Sphaerisporangium melleum]|uniref:SnoaL-like domain-containing protein n=1 Tax=Sphaerisporangium melleum TaxID=321316 RepID=A0A917RQ88_9ACTN|nr:nuclear transport factor 2 family protein [Sphaerisporangium melleum]GGL18127.1 hypothetical protein GCM10007964_70200 [Sphaerisporangium melleum]GII73072.1 hypothetical protein Sme01_55480 [Sphaerisporangium melleum]
MPDDPSVDDQLINAVNARDLAAATRLFGPRATYVCPGGVAEGREEIGSYFAIYYDAFADLTVTAHEKSACGDLVTLEWTLTGTHTGPLLLPGGDLAAPTGRRIAVRGCHVRTMDAGMIATLRVYYDQLELLTQLGISCLPV